MIEELQPDLQSREDSVPEKHQSPSLSELMEIAPLRFLLLFTAIYLFAEYCGNRRRPFWSDELFTYHLASVSSIRDIWPLIKQGIELNPPLPFWITWVVHHTLGTSEFVTRLPSILGFWGMCVCLFFYVKRRSDAVHGFVALLLPLFTYTAGEATWARGYGLLLGFSAVALLCWQLATDNIKRSLALPALTLGLAGALSCHYYGLYSAGAIAVGEVVRTRSRKQIDFPIFAAILLGVSSILTYLPLLKAVASGSKTFWIKPLAYFLYDSYADLFGPTAMVLILFLLLVLDIPKNKSTSHWTAASLPTHELAACLTFAAMPFTIFVASQVSPIAFFPRYVQPVVIGFAVAIPMFAYRVGGWNQSFRKLMISLVVWLCFTPWTIWCVVQVSAPKPWIAVKSRYYIPDENLSMPIVIDHDNDFMVTYHYAPEEVRQHLFYLYDPPSAIKYLGSDTSQHSLFLGQSLYYSHLVKYDDFVNREHEFLLLKTMPTGWILQKLLADGADVRLLQQNKEPGVFVKDFLLFQVKTSFAKSPH